MEDQSDYGGFTRSGLRYRLPSPAPTGDDEDELVVDNLPSVVPSSVAGPLIWDADMDGGYGVVKGPRRYSGAVGTIELEDFIQEFDTWCDMQMLRNAALFTPFLAWKGLFQHLEGPPMDDYHEFWRTHEPEIEAWRQYCSPTYVSIANGGSAVTSS